MAVERYAAQFNANLKTGRHDFEGMVRHPIGEFVRYDDYKALTAELEALRRDAARYTRLKQQARPMPKMSGAYDWFVRALGGLRGRTFDEAIDTVIDAARQQEATNEG